MNVHDRILSLLNERGWTLYKLAKEAGLYETTVYSWFDDNHFTPSRKSIEYVCAALGISQAEFYSNIDENKLSNEQLSLLEKFDSLSNNQKKIVLNLINSLLSEKDK